MEAQEILDRKIIEHLRHWRAKQLDHFKANCKICGKPLKASEVRFASKDTQSFFCEICWINRVAPALRKAKIVLDNLEKDVVGLLYGLVFHSDLLKTDNDFAELGKYVASVMKSLVQNLTDAGLEPDTVMSYWPESMFKRLVGIDLPDEWANRLFTASVIEDVVRYHTAKGLFIYSPDKNYWNQSFKDAPAAYALRKEPLRKVQPGELLEALRQAHR